jgi:hypothetical protein
MPEMTLNKSAPQTDAEYEIAIERCLEQMKRLREEINAEDQEIDRLKAETQAILAELRTL